MERLLPGFVTRGVSRQKMAEDANAPAFSDNRILSDRNASPQKKVDRRRRKEAVSWRLWSVFNLNQPYDALLTHTYLKTYNEDILSLK